MMYTEAIETIMPDVQAGSLEPFWFARDMDGKWNVRRDGAGDDPLAAQFSGADFHRASFPMVYDMVFTARLRKEYELAESAGNATPEMGELVDLFEDYAPEFSGDVINYLTAFDRPLDALHRMDVLGTDTFDVIERIEDIVEKRMSMVKDEPRPEQRNIEGYIEKSSIQIAGTTVVYAENPAFEYAYLVCNIKSDNPLGIEERYMGVAYNDFLEAFREFGKRIEGLAASIAAEREKRGLPIVALTAADCIPTGLDESLKGKLIVIKAEILSPEYRSADHQLQICTGGFGASPNSRGSAVYCKDLYTGEEQRFERHHVLGVAHPDRLPEWAKAKLAELQQGAKKPSLLGRLDDAKAQAAAQKAENKGKTAKKRSTDLEV